MKVLDWNGEDVPDALRELPPGRYVLQAVDDLVRLAPEDEGGIRAGLEQLDRGEGLTHRDVLDQARRAVRR
jgi:predicted transcriptional regulator